MAAQYFDIKVNTLGNDENPAYSRNGERFGAKFVHDWHMLLTALTTLSVTTLAARVCKRLRDTTCAGQ